MLGMIIQLVISWVIIWIFERGNLSFLGFRPTKERLIDFALFFLITAVCSSLGFLLRIYFGKEQWELNPLLNASLILKGIWQNIKSVMFEELIFRGVLFYIFLKKLRFTKAVIISAIGFGIYHWFSFGLFGNIPQMAIVFILTGIMGLLLAYGYAKTYSLYIPIAIHLGWNLINGFVFSQKSIETSIFIPVKAQPSVSISYLLYYSIIFLPMLCTWLFNFLLLKRHQQCEPIR